MISRTQQATDLRRLYGNTVTRQQVLAYMTSVGLPFSSTAWLRKGAEYRAGRGTYSVPESVPEHQTRAPRQPRQSGGKRCAARSAEAPTRRTGRDAEKQATREAKRLVRLEKAARKASEKEAARLVRLEKAARKASEKEAARLARLPVVTHDSTQTHTYHNPFGITRARVLSVLGDAMYRRAVIEAAELSVDFRRPAKQVSEEYSSHVTNAMSATDSAYITDGGDNNKPDLFHTLIREPLEIKVSASDSWLGCVENNRHGWYLLVTRQDGGWAALLVNMTTDDLWEKTNGMHGRSVRLSTLYKFICENPTKVDMVVGKLYTKLYAGQHKPHFEAETVR